MVRSVRMSFRPQLHHTRDLEGALRRQLSTTAAYFTNSPAHHFDSQVFVKQLQDTGMTRTEATGLLRALEGVFRDAGDSIMSTAVRRDEYERGAYQQKVEFNKFKSEVQLATKQDFGVLKSDGDRHLAELESLKQRLKEETARTTASVRLDLSFERGRIREDLGVRDIRIREVEGRIDNEVQTIRGNNAMMRSQSVQYAVGAIGVAASLFFGYLRLASARV